MNQLAKKRLLPTSTVLVLVTNLVILIMSPTSYVTLTTNMKMI